MNIKSLFIICALSMSLFFQGCSNKQHIPPANTNTAQLPTDAMPMLTEKKAVKPAQTHFDITTQAGFLGKSENSKAYDAAMIKTLNEDYEKKLASTSKYYDFKFEVHNVSGVTLYTTCFAYIKPRFFRRWRWRKTDIKEIKPGEKVEISMRMLDDHDDKLHVFGALGVFSNKIEAEDSTYELLPNENKLDLDLLSGIENKTIVIGIERYGFREPFYDYDFVDKQNPALNLNAELDFFVQNKTGKTLFITGFIYSKKAKGKWIAAEDAKDDMSVWRFYKTKVLRLEPNQTGYVDVDSIIPQRDRSFVRAYLGIFDETQENEAHNKTFELLSDAEKINLGLLSRRQARTIILEVERYGVANDIVDFTVKPIRWIDFTKIVR